MEIPPEIQARISQKQQHAWESGLIQGFSMYVNTVLKPKRGDSHKKALLSLGGKKYLVHFDGHVALEGAYDAIARLTDEGGLLLFELAYGGQTEVSWFNWATREPSAQSAVKAFIEGPWVEQFLSYLSQLSEQRTLEIEINAKTNHVDPLEDLKKRFGLE
jgi:hypothetical protein